MRDFLWHAGYLTACGVLMALAGACLLCGLARLVPALQLL